jgi:hypothetical protein
MLKSISSPGPTVISEANEHGYGHAVKRESRLTVEVARNAMRSRSWAFIPLGMSNFQSATYGFAGDRALSVTVLVVGSTRQ